MQPRGGTEHVADRDRAAQHGGRVGVDGVVGEGDEILEPLAGVGCPAVGDGYLPSHGQLRQRAVGQDSPVPAAATHPSRS
jgi:hypothetical protein